MDFDSFLQRATQQEAQNAEAEHYARDLTQRLMNEIARRSIPRVIDSDPEFETKQRHELAHSFEKYFYTDAIERPDSYPSNPTDRAETIRIFAQESVEYTILSQTSLLSRVTMLITVYEHAVAHGYTPDYQALTDSKKQLTADLLVLEQYNPTDPWIAFVNDMAPGDSLNTADPQDDKYMLVAYEHLANKDAEDRKKLEPLHRAYEIAGANYRQPTDHDVEIMSAVAHMMITGLRSGSAENAAAQRSARLIEIARERNLDTNIAKRIIEHIEIVYPL